MTLSRDEKRQRNAWEADINDFEIITRVLDGDRNSYADLVRRHHAKVIGLCGTILKDPVQAEDAAQDIFVKVFELLRQFNRNAAFGTWLYRIATNHCLDIKRQQRRDKFESWDFMLESGEKEAPVSQHEDDPARQFEKKETVQMLLNALSEKDRIVLMLREAQGLHYQEIADFLACSLDSVKSRLKRARAVLMEKFKEGATHGT